MDFNWSFHAFRFWGIDVRIHWTLPAFFVYYVLRAAEYSPSVLFVALFVILPFVLLFASVLAHELGHAFAARHFRLPVSYTILTPIGGMVMIGQSTTPRTEFAVAAAGPFVNFALVGLGMTAFLALGGDWSLSMLLPFVHDRTFGDLLANHQLGLLVLHDFVQTNAMLFLFNVLMVAYPLDGGRVLLSILWKRRGYRKGLLLTCKIARVFAVFMGMLAALTLSPMLGLIAVLVFVQATITIRQVPMMAEPVAQVRKAERSKPLPGPIRAWLLRRQAREIRRLLDKAQTDGIHALTDDEKQRIRDKDRFRWN